MSLTEGATLAANQLVLMRANRVQESSQCTYASSLHRYMHFCMNILGLSNNTVLPLEQGAHVPTEYVELFIAWATTKYKLNTIKATLNALVDWHKSKGLDQASIYNKRTQALLQTASIQQGPAGLPKGKTGMPKAILNQLIVLLKHKATQNPAMQALYIRDSAWLLLGFYGLFRRSEIIALNLEDVTFMGSTTKGYLRVKVKKSKTDKQGQGTDVIICSKTRDGTEVAAKVKEWIELRRSMGARMDEPLFTTWDLDTKSPSPQRIGNGQALAKRLQQYLVELTHLFPYVDINPNSYGMHSLRRGGVVAAWQAGIDIEKIKAHGRWRSDAVRAYLTADISVKLTVSLAM